jgi:tRNA-splicing endonuclease subunit Sen2
MKKKRGRQNDWSAHSAVAGTVTGELNSLGAVVRDAKECEALWRGGCFGKGLLSRSRAEALTMPPPQQKRRKDKKNKKNESSNNNNGNNNNNNNEKEKEKEKSSVPTVDNPFHGRVALDKEKAARVLKMTPLSEPVQLSPQETLYLVHEAMCLRVPMTSDQLWSHFRAQNARFALLYVAYRHYRTLGWIVRCGSKMGSDLVLYQDHPGRCHAEHSVRVLDKRNSADMPSWPELLALGRVSENVQKSLIFCRVDLRGEENMSDAVAQSAIEEFTYTRWSTGQTRDGDED